MGKPGRPSGQIKTGKIEVKIEPEMKKEFQRIVKQKGSNASVTICQLIAQYIENERSGSYEK